MNNTIISIASALMLFSGSVNAQVFDSVAIDASMIGTLGRTPERFNVFDEEHPGCEGCNANASIKVQLWTNGRWTDIPDPLSDTYNVEPVSGGPQVATNFTINGNGGPIYVSLTGVMDDGICTELTASQTPPWECDTLWGCTTLLNATPMFPGNGDYRITHDDGIYPSTTLYDDFTDNMAHTMKNIPGVGFGCGKATTDKFYELTIEDFDPEAQVWQPLFRITMRSWCDSCTPKTGTAGVGGGGD